MTNWESPIMEICWTPKANTAHILEIKASHFVVLFVHRNFRQKGKGIGFSKGGIIITQTMEPV